MIDLHTHSTFSDGFYTPTKLLNLALKIKLEALALTDHDAVGGLNELHTAAKKHHIEIINGAEMSVYYPKTDMEIIAMDIPDSSLDAFTIYQREEIVRREKLARIRIDLLKKAGYDITYEEVAYNKDGTPRTQIRRPHFVDILLKKGYIKTADEAYENIFGFGCPCYVANNPWPAKEMIKFIRDNGAKAILAHPVHLQKRNQELFDTIKELKSAGLSGIEVFHSSHQKDLRLECLDIIKDLKMITTGGSDFHGGTAHPENKLGTGNNNNLNIPYIVIEELKNPHTPSASYYKELKKYL